jgi:hypothetical protein
MTVPVSERETVREVIKNLATRHHYEDRTAISLTPDTICSYAQPDVHYPISIRAWVNHERIVIDVVQRRPDVAGESVAYSKVREELEGELDKHFGNRLGVVHKTRQAESRVVNAKPTPAPAPAPQ